MITLIPKRKFEVPVQAACISPDVFKGKTTAEIANLPVTEGNRQLKLCNLFEITEDNAETPAITINGDVGKVKRIGSCMTAGEIVINGDAACTQAKKCWAAKSQ